MTTPVSVAREWVTAANAGDGDRLAALSRPDIAIVGPRGIARGTDVLRDWLRRAGLTLETTRTFARGASVVMAHRATWQAPGASEATTAEIASRFEIEDGQVATYQRFDDLQQALASAALDDSHEIVTTRRTLFPILYARDLVGALRFYRDLLGLQESYRFPEDGDPSFVTLRWGTAEIGLGTYEPVAGLENRPLTHPAGGRGFELCVYVEDVDRVVAGLRQEGVTVLVNPVDQPWGERLAYVQDPEGNTVMLTASSDTTPPT